jgi:hypothetical protein
VRDPRRARPGGRGKRGRVVPGPLTRTANSQAALSVVRGGRATVAPWMPRGTANTATPTSA